MPFVFHPKLEHIFTKNQWSVESSNPDQVAKYMFQGGL